MGRGYTLLLLKVASLPPLFQIPPTVAWLVTARFHTFLERLFTISFSPRFSNDSRVIKTATLLFCCPDDIAFGCSSTGKCLNRGEFSSRTELLCPCLVFAHRSPAFKPVRVALSWALSIARKSKRDFNPMGVYMIIDWLADISQRALLFERFHFILLLSFIVNCAPQYCNSNV